MGIVKYSSIFFILVLIFGVCTTLVANEENCVGVEENFEEDRLACMARLSQIKAIIELDRMDQHSLFLVGSQSREISGFMDLAEIEEFLCNDGGIISFSTGKDGAVKVSCSIHGELKLVDIELVENTASKTETLNESDPENFDLENEIE